MSQVKITVQLNCSTPHDFLNFSNKSPETAKIETIFQQKLAVTHD